MLILFVGTKFVDKKNIIPVVLDPAPQMSNGYLHKYEFDFKQKIAKSNYTVAKSLNQTLRLQYFV